jgi:histidyl-tRNA synthetase
MSKINVSIPQGTRDFDAATVKKRQYIFNTIKNVFELYGFAPLETPAMENLETLMGKYGDEGDKLIFKILNNGLDHESKKAVATSAFENVLQGKNDKNLTERALKYDLTIPFARYVAMNHTKLTLPFKRYQIQPVWRADRPQRGRYREFFQCDADVVGSASLLNEVELINIYNTAFLELQIPVTIKINNRKILAALAEQCGGSQHMTNITVAIDKLDKIGLDKVIIELEQKNIDTKSIALIKQYLCITGNNNEKLEAISQLIGNVEIGKAGIDELAYVLKQTSSINHIELDFTLARGLNYYTGCIFEIKANGVQMGSIGGGGRYDDLTGSFGVPNIAGVGISFGIDRIYDVMDEMQLFSPTINQSSKILFFNLSEAENEMAFNCMQQLRNNNIACEMLFENQKIPKQYKYAEAKQVEYVVNAIDIATEKYSVKNIFNGSTQELKFDDLIKLLK